MTVSRNTNKIILIFLEISLVGSVATTIITQDVSIFSHVCVGIIAILQTAINLLNETRK